MLEALRRFGTPLFDLTLEDLSKPGTVFQIGTAPNRIDILTGVSGLSFEEAWSRHAAVQIGDLSVAVIGRQDLIRNKRATGRPQDLVDAERLDGRGD